jgi:hypothetical protein
VSESSELVAHVRRAVEVVVMVALGVATGFVVIQAAIWYPLTWPGSLLLVGALAFGALRVARARPYFVTAGAASLMGLGYGVALWVVLGGFG